MSGAIFGPAGNSELFYEQGGKHTYQAMKWIADKGLSAFEYSFGRGAKMSEHTGAKIAAEAKKYGISLSAHAPYFINLGTLDPEKIDNNIRYFTESALCAARLGADRVVFHPGSPTGQERGVAFENVRTNIKIMLSCVSDYPNITFCPETMGKINQIGDLAEVLTLCRENEQLIPAIDFGHLHTRGLGCLNSRADFGAILDELVSQIGFERAKHFHVHFSKIEFTAGGEKMHKTFADEGYGPDFNLLAPELIARNLEPRIICESKGTMAEDAATMMKIYNDIESEN